MIQEQFLIQDYDTLKALSHPLRLELMRQFKTAQTVKQVAEKINTPSTKLYYHVNLLEKQGLLQITETNLVSGIMEKTYLVSAHRIEVDDALIGGGEEKIEQTHEMAEAILDFTRQSLKRSIMTRKENFSPQNNNIVYTHYRLTEVEAQSFMMQLEVLEEEMARLSAGRKPAPHFKNYNLTTLFFELTDES